MARQKKTPEDKLREEISLLKTRIEIIDDQSMRVRESMQKNKEKLEEIEVNRTPLNKVMRTIGICFAIGVVLGFVVFMIR